MKGKDFEKEINGITSLKISDFGID